MSNRMQGNGTKVIGGGLAEVNGSPKSAVGISLTGIAVCGRPQQNRDERAQSGGLAMQDQAWLDGQKNGRIDRLRGTKNEQAWVVLLNEGYSRNYSLGYRQGWTRPNEGAL
jgi:hypothetical protein